VPHVRIFGHGKDRHSQSVLAEDYPPLPHNHQMTKDQSYGAFAIPYSLFPIPYSLFPVPCFSGTLPPSTPLGYKFPLKSCRLFLTRLESTPIEKLLALILSHREICPLKITGKTRFFTKKRPRSAAPAPFR